MEGMKIGVSGTAYAQPLRVVVLCPPARAFDKPKRDARHRNGRKACGGTVRRDLLAKQIGGKAGVVKREGQGAQKASPQCPCGVVMRQEELAGKDRT